MILNPFKGKNILITGGSKGIGLCMAKELASLQANIAIIARDKDALGLAQRQIEESGSGIRCLAYACDVTDPDTLGDYINMVRYEFGSIDGIIANSGYCHPGNFHEIDLSDIDRQIDVNLKGVIYTLRLGIPHLLENSGGFIAITSSPAGNAGIYGFSIYGPTKSALNILSHTLRAEYAAENIRVHLLLPPDTDTPGYAEEVPLYPPETQAILAGGVLLKPEPVAKKFIHGIASNKKMIAAGFSTRLLLLIMRFAPFIWDFYVKSKVRSIKHQDGEPAEISAKSQKPSEPKGGNPDAEAEDIAPDGQPASDVSEPSGDSTHSEEDATEKGATEESGEKESEEARESEAESQEASVDTPDQEEEATKETAGVSEEEEFEDLTEIIVCLEIEDLKPFLDRITKYVSGLDHEVADILMDVAGMDTKQDKSWEFLAKRQQLDVPFRMDVSMNSDDSIDLRFHTVTKLAMIIDQEFSRMFSA